jgi:NIPSNAP
MNRRTFVTATSAAGLSAAAAENSLKNSVYLLFYYYMRNGTQVERTTAYLRDTYAPAAKRNGTGPVGFFGPVFGDRAPFILSLASYPSWSAIETGHAKFAADEEFQKGWDAYNVIGDPAYDRMEVSMMYAFDKFPVMEIPPTEGRRAARIFELRTYENPNEKALARKIKMFEDGEAGIFKRLGMAPVFFGRNITGPRLPSLSYMLSYDDLAARDRLWRAFGSDPEWQKLRAQPGLSDAEIVSNITNTILRPLPFSMIR